MKEKDVPQEKSEKFEQDFGVLQYALNDEGKFTAVKSYGWEPKNTVMENAWEHEKEKMEEARELVRQGKKSPIYYHMFKALMDIKVLSGYTGFSKFKTKRHFKPSVYNKLSETSIQKYIEAFSLKTKSELENIEDLD